MRKDFLKQYILFFLVSLGFLGLLITTDFISSKDYLKHGTLAMWGLNMLLFMIYTKKIRNKAKQCPTCNLFVPLEDNTLNTLTPHCCYQKPKGDSR